MSAWHGTDRPPEPWWERWLAYVGYGFIAYLFVASIFWAVRFP